MADVLAGAAAEPAAAAVASGIGRPEAPVEPAESVGLAAADARARAVFGYAAYRGLLQLAHEAPASLPDDWTAYAALVKAQLARG